MKKSKITEKELRNIIKNIIAESVFGLSGSQAQQWTGKNPMDDYPIDYHDMAAKMTAFLQQVTLFKDYIDGVEEDLENGVEGTRGLHSTMQMRNMWRDDDDFDKEDEKYYADKLNTMSRNISSLLSDLEEIIDYANYNID